VGRAGGAFVDWFENRGIHHNVIAKKKLKLYLRKIWVVASIGKLKEQVKFQHFFV